MQRQTIFRLKAKGSKAPSKCWKDRAHTGSSGPREAARRVHECPGHRGTKTAPSPMTKWRDVEKGFPTFWYFCPHRGHSPEWYNKGFGHLCAAEVAKIRNSFQPLIAEGPETKIWVFPSVTSNSGKRKRKPTRGRERACEKARVRGRLVGVVHAYSGNADESECRRCENF